MKPDPTPPARTPSSADSPVVSDDPHDLALIVERLAWTPEQRLDANMAFLRFYFSARPGGPLMPGDR
jgi:hypothetical protein